jgi:hypothetical protein
MFHVKHFFLILYNFYLSKPSYSRTPYSNPPQGGKKGSFQSEVLSKKKTGNVKVEIKVVGKGKEMPIKSLTICNHTLTKPAQRGRNISSRGSPKFQSSEWSDLYLTYYWLNISWKPDPPHIKTIPSEQPRIILNIHNTKNIHRNQGNTKNMQPYKYATAKAVEIPTHLHPLTLLPFIILLCRS